MKQFTVYASDGEEGGACCAVYMVNFIEGGAITYPLRKGWQEASDRVERGINRSFFGGEPKNPFAKTGGR